MFLFFVLWAMISSKCLEIKSSKFCQPWGAQAKIDTKALSSFYHTTIIDVKDWERMLLKTPKWDTLIGCTPKAEILYYHSFACMTDLFLTSAGCNRNLLKKSQPLCSEICDQYGLGIDQMLLACPPSSNDIFKRNRMNLFNASHICQSVQSRFQASSCITGVREDAKWCGNDLFGNNFRFVQQ